jgi:hypothetical protein
MRSWFRIPVISLSPVKQLLPECWIIRCVVAQPGPRARVSKKSPQVICAIPEAAFRSFGRVGKRWDYWLFSRLRDRAAIGDTLICSFFLLAKSQLGNSKDTSKSENRTGLRADSRRRRTFFAWQASRQLSRTGAVGKI